MSDVKSQIRMPFRILGVVLCACAMFSWWYVILSIMLEHSTGLSIFMQDVILIEVPLVLFYLGIPAVYGYYPSAVARWVPIESLKFLNRTVRDLFGWLFIRT